MSRFVNPEWGPLPTISDVKLALRPFDPRDAWAMRGWDQDPESQRFFEYPTLPPPDEHLRRAWWVIQRWRIQYARGETIPFIIEEANSLSILGSVDLHQIRGDEADISYMTVPEHRRRGIATSAVRLLLAEANTRFGVETVFLEHHPDNAASAIVAKRAGFTEVERSADRIRYVVPLVT